jgi:hypothetical protein
MCCRWIVATLYGIVLRLVAALSDYLCRHTTIGLWQNPTRDCARFIGARVARIQPTQRVTDNPHERLAHYRRSAADAISYGIRDAGLAPWHYQAARRDFARGDPGYRDYRWAKDQTTPLSSTALMRGHVRVLTDVDYYVDMPRLLAAEPHSTVLYTFTPDAAASDEAGLAWMFRRDNSIEISVPGARPYAHHLWDYSGDILSVAVWSWWCWRQATYRVTRIATATPWSVVVLHLENVRYSLFPAYSLRPVRRLAPVVGDFVRLTVQRGPQLMKSTAMVEQYTATTLTAAEDSRVLVMQYASKYKPDPHTADRRTETVTDLAPLIAYIRFGCADPWARVEKPVLLRPRHYVIGREVRPDDKRVLHPYMPSVVSGLDYVPIDCVENDRATVAGRIENVRSFTQPSAYIQELMDDFVSHFPCGITPATSESVRDKQSSPSQRAILERAGMLTLRQVLQKLPILRAFMKAEAYAEIKDPRNITPVDGGTKYCYSEYMYAVADVMKLFPWYAFGKAPPEIALRVAEICRDAKDVSCSDAKRLDGHISPVARMLEDKILRRVFVANLVEEALALAASQRHRRAMTRNGVRYDSGTTRLSGSPETSVFNTALSAFHGYCTYRMMGLNDREAWDKLGIHGGDDGVDPEQDAIVIRRAAKRLGLVMKVNIVQRGEYGVNFFNRWYRRDVWQGARYSSTDVKRMLAKLHLTQCRPGEHTPESIFLAKMVGPCREDRETPIVEHLVRYADRLLEMGAEPGGPQAYFVERYPGQFYPNAPDPDHFAKTMQDLPDFDEQALFNFATAAPLPPLSEAPVCFRSDSREPKGDSDSPWGCYWETPHRA